MKKPRLPSRAEVKKANAGSCSARGELSRKYGLSGAVARAIGLESACSIRRRRKR